MAALILVNGHPGSGKTTLARWLASELRLPFLGKDLFKEVLYEHEPPADREASRALGRAAYDLLFAAIEAAVDAGASVVAEAPLHRAFVQQRVEDWRDRGAALTQIVLTADPATLEARYVARRADRSRHADHDTGFNLEELRAVLAAPIDAPDVADTVHVDTTDFASVDHESLLARLRAWLSALDQPRV